MIGIYARVSTEDQAKNGYSLQDQVRECKKKAGTEKAMEFVDDGFSGEFLDRPALSKLRKNIRDGIITKVICLDPDRLSRKLVNQLILSEEIEKRADLIFVNGEYKQSPEGILFYQMRGAVSEFEKAKIKERMGRGRKEKARQGKVVRDYQVYGYDFDLKTQQFVVNKEESEIVKLIFNLFTEKNNSVQGINGIAKYLTEQGIPTKRGASVWHRQVVRQNLMNRAYIGEFYQNRWNTEGMLGNKYREEKDRIHIKERPKEEWILVPCPSIIDEETFIYAQKLLEESRRRWAGTSKKEYLLSGLVRCGNCRNTMTGRRANNWGKFVLEYCDVKNTAGAKNIGCGKKIKADELDALVWDTILAWLNQSDEIAAEAENNEVSGSFHSFGEAELSRVKKRLDEIKKGRSNLINLLTNAAEDLGESGLEETRQKLRQLKDDEKYLMEREAELEKELKLQQQDIPQRNQLHEALAYYLSKAPEEISFYDKKELIRYVVKEIRVYDNEIKVYGF